MQGGGGGARAQHLGFEAGRGEQFGRQGEGAHLVVASVGRSVARGVPMAAERERAAHIEAGVVGGAGDGGHLVGAHP